MSFRNRTENLNIDKLSSYMSWCEHKRKQRHDNILKNDIRLSSWHLSQSVHFKKVTQTVESAYYTDYNTNIRNI